MRSTKQLLPLAGILSARAGLDGTISHYRDKQTIYPQGKAGDSLFYIQNGRVTLSIRSKRRRPAVIAILGAGDFFGQRCLAGHPHRMCTATAITPCSILIIQKKEMLRFLLRKNMNSTFFVSYLLAQIERYQENLADLITHSAEQRLAHVLLQLAEKGEKGLPQYPIPILRQQVLADMTGTTRSRISLFMNRFRKRGFISYNGGLEVHRSLRNVLLGH